MKNILHLVALATCVVSSCSKQLDRPATEKAWITVIDDQTDPRKIKLLSEAITALYQFPNRPNQEAYFRLTSISDRQLNPVVEYHLANGITTEKQNKFDDPEYRGKLITLFYKKIQKAFIEYYQQFDSSSSMPYSECYRTIAKELALLSKSGAHNCNLVVHSDLLERSTAYDCYTGHGRTLMHTNPQLVADILLKSYPLPDDLSRINVFFVFSARDRNEEAQFLEMVAVYKLLLERRQVKVVVQATNKYFEQ